MADWDGALRRKGFTEWFVGAIVRGKAEAGFSLDHGAWNDCLELVITE